MFVKRACSSRCGSQMSSANVRGQLFDQYGEVTYGRERYMARVGLQKTLLLGEYIKAEPYPRCTGPPCARCSFLRLSFKVPPAWPDWLWLSLTALYLVEIKKER